MRHTRCALVAGVQAGALPIVCARAAANPQRNGSYGFLAQRAMRQSDDRSVDDRGMGAQNILHFGSVDILASSQDHVLDAIDDIDIPVLVHPREVACPNPTIHEGGGGRFGIRSEEHTSELQSLLRISY